MNTKLIAIGIASGVLLGPVCNAAEKQRTKGDDDMQRAIAWERYKEAAAARQARLEARHPSVTYSGQSANREIESTPPQPVKDRGPAATKKDKPDKDKPDR